MNETKQNALIAGAMGTHFIQKMSDRWIILDRSGAEMECVFENGITQSSHPMNFEFLEDFTKDLNAMHEAEKVVKDHGLYTYWISMIQESDHLNEHWNLATATSKQRAEAFLRTIGKWEEEA